MRFGGASLACTSETDIFLADETDKQRQHQELPATAYRLQILTKDKARYFSYLLPLAHTDRRIFPTYLLVHLPHASLGPHVTHPLPSPAGHLALRLMYGVHRPAPASPSRFGTTPALGRIQVQKDLHLFCAASLLRIFGRISHPGQICTSVTHASPSPPCRTLCSDAGTAAAALDGQRQSTSTVTTAGCPFLSYLSLLVLTYLRSSGQTYKAPMPPPLMAV